MSNSHHSTLAETERLKRWRLILGQEATQSCGGLQGDDLQMDRVLEALYDSDRQAGLGSSSPNVNRWLGDIRKYFPKSTVRVMQQDALAAQAAATLAGTGTARKCRSRRSSRGHASFAEPRHTGADRRRPARLWPRWSPSWNAS